MIHLTEAQKGVIIRDRGLLLDILKGHKEELNQMLLHEPRGADRDEMIAVVLWIEQFMAEITEVQLGESKKKFASPI